MRLRIRLGTPAPLRTLRFASISLSLMLSPGLSGQTVYTVNTVSDADDGTCAAGHCSLREAITASNHSVDGGIIRFNIPGAGPHTIRPTSPLPSLEGNVIIDGTTEPDFAGTPVIELDGSLAGYAHGFDIVGSQNIVRGLVINRFVWNGIQINTDCTFNSIEGNFVGTDVTGTLDMGNGKAGVLIGQAANNTVGGTTVQARNLISGNIEGVTIVDPSATGNLVAGNFIGTDWSGTSALPNGVGVLLLAPGNTIGGAEEGAGNLISGNTNQGINLGPPNATGNIIAGNHIGVDASGTAALGNDVGVWVENVADNVIGGTSASARNVISGNREGIGLWEAGATGNTVLGNYIGTNQSGDAAIPNDFGIVVYAPDNTIGGTEEGAGNLISGNRFNGVNFYGENATGNSVEGNLIGTNAAGTSALGNGEQGVALVDAAGNTIGGTTSGAGNALSGNTIAGVFLLGEATENNVIQGNVIGTDPTGTSAIGNGESGVAIHSAKDNLVGGTEPGARNILSGNVFGVLIGDLLADGNRIQGNYIGTNAAGDAAVPNTQSGILDWGQNTIIGGTEAGAGNVISGNITDGIGLAEASTGTLIQGNYIGTDATGSTALGNTNGVFANFSPNNTIGGTSSGARNVISGNAENSITLFGLGSTGNTIQGNYIGTDVTGTMAVANGGGFWITDAPDNTIGGTNSGAGNLISGKTGGIRVDGANASGNVIQGNTLGMDVTGTLPMGVRGAGVRFSNGASGNTVGGTESGAGNIIANSGWVGIVLFADAGNGNRILSNSIYDNGALGIDLGRDTPTLNDDGDSDTGPNNLQNFPVLTSVVSNGGAAIQATLNSTPSSSFTLDFFSNTVCDESGFGEGQNPLGSASLTTDASGTGTVAAAFSGVTGTVLTATATDANGNTSEFSECGDLTTLAVTPTPTTRTVTPGQSAVYTLSLTAQGGVFEETVDLSCSGNPAGTTCTFDQDQVTLAAGQASATMTVTTVAPAGTAPGVPGDRPPAPKLMWLFGVVGVGVLVGMGRAKLATSRPAVVGGAGPARSWPAFLWLFPTPRFAYGAFVLLILLFASASCGDEGTTPPSGGTPAGTYQLSVTATWESVQISSNVTMVVQ